MGPGDHFCHSCGWNSRVSLPPVRVVVNPSDRSRLAALLLCVLLGWLGAHRFYVGKVGTGVLWLFSLGFLGIGVIYDLVLIATGEFRDDQNRRVVHWE
jgi:TM2 domain-containing membrane protein YozV